MSERTTKSIDENENLETKFEQFKAQFLKISEAKKDALKMFQRLSESSRLTKIDKAFISNFQVLFEMVADLAEKNLVLEYRMEIADQAVSDLFESLRGVAVASKNHIDGLKTDMADLKEFSKSPMLTRVNQFIEQIEKNAEKRKKEGKAYID